MADTVMVSSGSEAEGNRDRVSDVENDENGSWVVAEDESVLDINSGLVDKAKVDSSRGLELGGAYSLPVNMNDVFGFDEEFDGNGEDGGTGVPVITDVVSDEIGEVACTDNEESVISCSQANVGKQGILGEKMENRNDGFLVGDFVWGKIKSHPWWPGQIYDSKDASAFAVKHSQEGRILVAYFGDGSCSWCLPSQLVPFVDNFKQMSSDSSSKSLLDAIQCALNDIGRLVEENMTCKCVPSDRRDGLAKPMVLNAGVKNGVLVPDVDIRRLSVPEYCSNGLLEILTDYAKGVSVDCLLELAVLKSSLSAFYRAKGGRYGLPMYCEPVYIEGLEDKSKMVSAEMGDLSVSNEISDLGLYEDDWLSSSPAAVTSLGDKIYQRRKQKSVSELMGEDNDSEKPKSLKRAKEVKEEKGIRNSTSSGKRRKSGDNGEKGVGSSNGKTSRKRMEVGHLLGKSNKIEVAVSEKSSDEANDESETISSPRERKKSKYLSPPYTNPGWSVGNSGSDKSWTKTEHSTSLPSRSKLADISSDEELPIIQLKERADTIGQTSESYKKLTFSVSDVDVQVDELLSEVQSAASDHLYLSNKGSLETVWAFVSALRSSTFTNGVDYKIYQISKTGGNAKILLKDQELDAFALDKAKSNDAKTPKSVLRKKTEGRKSNFKKSKMTEGDVSTWCLILTFAPGFPLPSKEEILDLYGKFGSLNEKETNVMTESRSVRIVYTKESNAEAAFKSSVTESPYGLENVNYWLQRPSANSKSKKASVKNPYLSEEMDEFMSDILFSRQKLEIMVAILENYHSKFSAEEKSSLEDEMKKLMKNVETVSEMVRVTAEKYS